MTCTFCRGHESGLCLKCISWKVLITHKCCAISLSAKWAVNRYNLSRIARGGLLICRRADPRAEPLIGFLIFQAIWQYQTWSQCLKCWLEAKQDLLQHGIKKKKRKEPRQRGRHGETLKKNLAFHVCCLGASVFSRLNISFGNICTNAHHQLFWQYLLKRTKTTFCENKKQTYPNNSKSANLHIQKTTSWKRW